MRNAERRGYTCQRMQRAQNSIFHLMRSREEHASLGRDAISRIFEDSYSEEFGGMDLDNEYSFDTRLEPGDSYEEYYPKPAVSAKAKSSKMREKPAGNRQPSARKLTITRTQARLHAEERRQADRWQEAA